MILKDEINQSFIEYDIRTTSGVMTTNILLAVGNYHFLYQTKAIGIFMGL